MSAIVLPATANQSYLFSELTADQSEDLLQISTEHIAEDGEKIIVEGARDRNIFILLEGAIEVVKTSGELNHVLTTITGIEVLGEFTIFDNEPRSSSIVAVTSVRYLKVRLDDLHQPSHTDLYSALLKICGNHIVQRIRLTNNVATDALEAKLEESKARNAIGIFFVYIVSSLALYTISLRYLLEYKHLIPGGTRTLTVALLLTLAPICLLAIKKTPYPFSKFGLTLKDWKPALIDALKWSTVAIVGITIAKYVFLRSLDSDIPLFSPTMSFSKTGTFNLALYLGAFAAYILTCPLQELIVRGSLQSCLQHFLSGPPVRVTWTSIIVSNLIFAMCHSHIRFTFALAAFIPGLLWDWLYSRNLTLVGPVASHMIIGVYFLFILGTGSLI